MGYRDIVLSREQLYELVWTVPVMAAADRYGLTGTGFAKICQRLRVPVPPRGYWAKTQAGHKVRKAPLPDPLRGQPVEHRLQRWLTEEAEYLNRDDVRVELERDLGRLRRVEVAPGFDGAHPIVRASAPLLRESKDVAATRRERCCLAVSVGPAFLDRALLALDALFRVLEEHGFTVEATAPRPVERRERGTATYDALPSETWVKLADAAVGLEILEERRVWQSTETRGLALHITNPESGVGRSSWADSASHTLEEQLQDAARSIVQHAWVKQAKADGERLHRDLERQREEARAEARRSRRMARDVDERLKAWRQAQEIQALLIEASRKTGPGGIETGPWIGWARRRADMLVAWAIRPGP